jgi:hypothetical protein
LSYRSLSLKDIVTAVETHPPGRHHLTPRAIGPGVVGLAFVSLPASGGPFAEAASPEPASH